jgi:hypothetical protein
MSLIKSFKEWLNADKEPTTILERMWHVNESLNTPVNIYKTEKAPSGVTYYYIKLGSKDYRIFTESLYVYGEQYIHLGFERYNRDWSPLGLTNDLSMKEILSLFSTIKVVILMIKPEGIYIANKLEPGKITKYYNMLINMDLKEYMYARLNDHSIILYKKDSLSDIELNKSYKGLHKAIKNFKYKVGK